MLHRGAKTGNGKLHFNSLNVVAAAIRSKKISAGFVDRHAIHVCRCLREAKYEINEG